MESYGFDARYLISRRNGTLEMAIPVMEVSCILSGRRAVALPFSDYCDPLLGEGVSFQKALAAVYECGRTRGWRSFEVRRRGPLPPEISASATFRGHVLDLLPDERVLYGRFRGSTQRNIRKAASQSVSVTMNQTDDTMAAFYRLNCLTRRDHGLPPQPTRFFASLSRAIRKNDSGFVAIAYFQGKPIAGAVYLHFGDKAVYKFGASDRRYQKFRANNLVMWEAIRWYAARGTRTLCLGRTEPDNEGLRQFKNGWGTREDVIGYVKYDYATGAYVTSASMIKGVHNRFFRNMPISVSRCIGSAIYKYMA